MTQDLQPSELSLACDANERVGASVLLDSSGRALVTLRGEQDILTVVAARRLLVDAIRLGAGQLIIDLCDVCPWTRQNPQRRSRSVPTCGQETHPLTDM